MVPTAGGGQQAYVPSAAVARRMPSKWPRPAWHAPWKLYRVISGHLGCAAGPPEVQPEIAKEASTGGGGEVGSALADLQKGQTLCLFMAYLCTGLKKCPWFSPQVGAVDCVRPRERVVCYWLR